MTLNQPAQLVSRLREFAQIAEEFTSLRCAQDLHTGPSHSKVHAYKLCTFFFLKLFLLASEPGPGSQCSLWAAGNIATFLCMLALDHQPLPDVHLTNVAVQKTSPDYHPKKVRKLAICPPSGPSGWDKQSDMEPKKGHSLPERVGLPFPSVNGFIWHEPQYLNVKLMYP